MRLVEKGRSPLRGLEERVPAFISEGKDALPGRLLADGLFSAVCSITYLFSGQWDAPVLFAIENREELGGISAMENLYHLDLS